MLQTPRGLRAHLGREVAKRLLQLKGALFCKQQLQEHRLSLCHSGRWVFNKLLNEMHASGSVHGTSALANAFSFLLSCYTGSRRLRPPVCTGMNVSMDAWLPKSVLLLRDYDLHKFVSDLIAGITVGLVALPLAMAFAIASGVPPQAGLYCAIVTGFLISALGGSKTQIGGPTGAFVVVVAGIIAKHGIDGLLMCTMMAGVLLVLLGITGMGTMVKYFPRPVVVGFTNGIAILIASTQVRDFFGLKMEHVPGDFFHRMMAFGQAWNTFSVPATAVSILSIATMVYCLKYARKIPGAILVTFGATAAVMFVHLSVETIGTRFGGIPSGLPKFAVPHFHYDVFRQLLSAAFTVAMLGAIESLMSAVVSDRMSNDKHNPNVELIGQGIANIVSPLCGGLPATGAIARTATNVRSGAKTPIAGIIHAFTLLGS